MTNPNIEKINQQKVDLAKKVEAFSELLNRGVLDLSSEATARSWIEDLLKLFGWNPLNPNEVDQEIFLSENAQQNLEEIDSHHKKPDYLLCNGSRQFLYLDAKKVGEEIEDNKKISFQIRSYGWSAGHPCAIVTNFREVAIYDCRFKPHKDDAADVARVDYFDYTKYLEKFDILSRHLERSRVLEAELNDLYSDKTSPKGSKPLDKDFSEHIRNWRLKFSNAIFSNHNNFSIEKISHLTQVLIDRFLFLRVAEGLKIERENTLLEMANIESDASWGKIKEHFSNYCARRYSGALFAEQHIFDEINIPITEVFGFIETLYYPYPYRFDVITPNLLGNIYERYLGRRLVRKTNLISDEFKEEYQKTKGAVYTPSTVVNYICEQTIRPILETKTFTGLTEVKICDPACGSGSFLLGAFDFLLSEATQRFSNESKFNQKKFSNWFWINPRNGRVYAKSSAKKMLLNNCIFGLDIDPQAAEISRLSLSLKAMENLSVEPEVFMELGLLEMGLLSGIGKNIRIGNALVDTTIIDSLPHLIDDHAQLKKLKPYDWKSDEITAPIFRTQGGFNAIIGNPPYIEVKHYKKDLPAMHEFLSDDSENRLYKSCGAGKTDISMPFIERGLQLLCEEGRLGFIIQNRFFKTQYGENSRKMLGESRAIEKIVDFGSLKIFPERTTYTCVLLLSKSKKKKKYSYSRIENYSKLEAQLRDPGKYSVPTYELENELTGEPWFFGPQKLLDLRISLKKKFGTIEKYKKCLEINMGLQVLYKKIYYIKGEENGGLVNGKNLLDEDVEVETAITRPLVVNREFYPFKKLKKNNFVIFPYTIGSKGSGSKKKLISKPISQSQLSSDFPIVDEYLKSKKAFIQKKVETLVGASWFLYTYEKNLISQASDKVLIPSTLKDLTATVDIGGGFYQDNVRVNALQFKGASSYQYRAICAVINSRLFDCLAKITAERLDNGYFQMNRQFLEPIPFPFEKFLAGGKAIDGLSSLSEKLEIACESFSQADEQENKNAARLIVQSLQKQLDEIVEKEIYELSATDRETLSLYSSRMPIDGYIDFIKGASEEEDEEQEEL